MRWQKKSRELEKYAKELQLLIENKRKIYIFGAGMVGKKLLSVLKFYECETVFIDNNIDKQGKLIEDTVTVSLDTYLDARDGYIVVAVSAANVFSIVKQLEEVPLQHGVDFWLNEEFSNYIFPVLSTYCYNKSYMALAQISLTERCSLRCKKCAHGCFAVRKDAKDLSLSKVYKSADSFFAKVDFVKEFVLIGGEPLLYEDLAQVIRYIGGKYRRQIGTYSITTNGTIIPNEDILTACKTYGVLFNISNYEQQIPQLEERHKQIITILKENNILHSLGQVEKEWVDYGFDYVNRNASAEELIKVFDACKTPCREVRENKLYYCVMARSVSENLGYGVGQDDYLDLDRLEGENYKKELLEFTLGYSEKGYLDMCNYCHGAEAKNYPIPAAEQI